MQMPTRAVALGLTALCMAASGSAPTYTLIVGPRTGLGPLAGVPANLVYTPVSGAIGDLNGDGAPDIVLGINGGRQLLSHRPGPGPRRAERLCGGRDQYRHLDHRAGQRLSRARSEPERQHGHDYDRASARNGDCERLEWLRDVSTGKRVFRRRWLYVHRT